MQQAVLELFPNSNVEYRFKNRGKHRFTPAFLAELKRQIQLMSTISLTDKEYLWIKENIPFFTPAYLEYLKNYRFDPSEIQVSLGEDNDLVIDIGGSWHSTILWEVPLMAMISELYFKMIDTEWDGSLDHVYAKAHAKHAMMRREYASFAEFGTRRRRSYAIQDKVIQAFQTYSGFNGTSNVHFAMKYNLKPIGTMAHEWIMGVSALEGLRHANFHALQNWVRVYNADLGIALTDTFGTPAFFKNFNMRLAKLYDGVRHDSGNPLTFADSVIEHYKSLGINPMSKVIVFSDGLDVKKCLEIAVYCQGRIRFSFGIGTHFTNDFEGSPALNMVIKIWKCDGVYVVKLGDGTGKTMGNGDAVRVAQWTFNDTPLDVVR
jgi:nicotinate phosphoribosyltransferase